MIHDVLLMNVLENIGPYRRVQICLHVLKYEIDVAVIVRLEHILELHYVLVLLHLL